MTYKQECVSQLTKLQPPKAKALRKPTSSGALAVNRGWYTAQRKPAQHLMRVMSCSSEVPTSHHANAINMKPSLELHLSCFPQALKMYQKTALGLYLVPYASFHYGHNVPYLCTSGLKSSWRTILRWNAMASRGRVSSKPRWKST